MFNPVSSNMSGLTWSDARRILNIYLILRLFRFHHVCLEDQSPSFGKNPMPETMFSSPQILCNMNLHKVTLIQTIGSNGVTERTLIMKTGHPVSQIM
jgi:hypothetical protein